MTELLFFKYDHSADVTLPARQISALPKVFDLLDAFPDGHIWSTRELTGPRFRIITWPLLAWPLPAAAQEFLNVEEPTSTTYLMYRKVYLNLKHATIPVALRNWWDDDTRAQPTFNVTLTVAQVLNNIKATRTSVPK